MPFVIDIGNTSAKVYALNKNKVSDPFLFDEKDFERSYAACGKKTDVIIASVVPQKTAEISAQVRRITGSEPFVITHCHYTDIKSLYRNINELGIDRLCNAAYAAAFHKKNAIVIDLGSAVTFEIINSEGVFEGGMILPGIRLQYISLSKNTALLPELKRSDNPALIGRSTRECIISGVENGIACLCGEMVSRIKKELGCEMKVILSGGDAEFFSKLVSFGHIVEKNTVPLGAYEIFRSFKPGSQE
jgi:type III pantothenate kinase